MALPSTIQFAERLAKFNRIFVLTGAGISAKSGIPTYRNDDGEWVHSKPVEHGDFVSSQYTRRRYWARSMLGWPRFRTSQPTKAHRWLAKAEEQGRVSAIVTQNVDTLHQKAGSTNVVDLHGRLDQVICLNCNDVTSRDAFQERLVDHNTHLPLERDGAADHSTVASKPDGDVDLNDFDFGSVRIPSCTACNDGVIKPNVTFFGATVDNDLRERAFGALQDSDALLVVGSSLQVLSGFRFIRVAHKHSIPCFAINPGVTRADSLFTLKLPEQIDDVVDVLAGAGIGG